jgi:hypothetical protein
MAKGGKRRGAGAKKGKLQKRTVEKMELERQFRARIAEQLEPLADALLRAAQGVEHLQAKDKRSQWTSVTDPGVMSKVLNGPDELRRISAKDPDVRALKECFDRLFGAPKQHVEVEDVTPVTDMSDEDLKRLARELAE